jgi:hypothetical protein
MPVAVNNGDALNYFLFKPHGIAHRSEPSPHPYYFSPS